VMYDKHDRSSHYESARPRWRWGDLGADRFLSGRNSAQADLWKDSHVKEGEYYAGTTKQMHGVA
jgi:hypothetical protein